MFFPLLHGFYIYSSMALLYEKSAPIKRAAMFSFMRYVTVRDWNTHASATKVRLKRRPSMTCTKRPVANSRVLYTLCCWRPYIYIKFESQRSRSQDQKQKYRHCDKKLTFASYQQCCQDNGRWVLSTGWDRRTLLATRNGQRLTI